MRNGFVRFVAHVGKTKCFAAKSSVTGIDDEVMFLAQALGKIDNVDVLVVRDTGQRFRAETFLREEIEARFLHPIVDERVGTAVADVTRVESFSENIFEL